MLVGAGAMRTRNSAHAAVVARDLVECEPGRDDGRRLQPEIGVVLVPAHELAVLRILDPEPRRHDEQVRARKVRDCAEEARVTGEAPSPVEVEMPLDVNCLDRRTAGLRLVGLEPPAAVGGLIGRYRDHRRDEAGLRKGPDLTFAQYGWHSWLRVEV